MPSSTQSGSVAAYVLDRLHAAWGLERIYGYPGDGINGFIGAFHEVGDRLAFVQTRHEEIAALAATADAKLGTGFAACLATSGPGAIHLLNGLYDAKLDHQPVVAIVGQQKRMSIGAGYQQEIDLQALFKDVCSDFVQTCMEPSQARHLVDRAVRTALVSRAPTCVIFPNDVQEADYSDPPREHGAVYSGGAIRQPHIVPHDAELHRAAEVLNAGERVAILIGQGAAGAADEVVEVADVLGTGVAKALNGRDALPDDLPFVTGACGLLGTKPTHEMMEGCDTLLMVGTSFPYAEWLPPEGQARGVEIDIDGRQIGARYPMEVNLIGDARDTLRALLPLLERKPDPTWRERLEGEVRRWWEVLDARAREPADPINPQLVFQELSPRLPEGAILTADSGSATNWWARHLKLRTGMRAALSGTLATMAPAIPYALGAKFTHPDRPVIACLGDGAMQMLGINALIDVAKFWRDGAWSDGRLVVLVLNNRDLNQVTWEQRVLAGDPRTDVTQLIPDFPYARYAELIGLGGIRVDSPERVGPAWDEALAADRPVVLEAGTDPNTPPLPPHIRPRQVKAMTQALLGGDPEAVDIMKQSLRGKLREFVTR
ncbi:MAG TPA: thiamine pyrophosphate-requiring protein [Thermoleophilaceae bacterium]|nr:thiamine pyrophosphate-requiring protein [Thermoleophilaceae bacterium]